MEEYPREMIDYIIKPTAAICRICCKEEKPFGSILDNYMIETCNEQWLLSIKDILSELTRTDINVDELPSSLCENCCLETVKCFQFIKEFHSKERLWYETVNHVHSNLEAASEKSILKAKVFVPLVSPQGLPKKQIAKKGPSENIMRRQSVRRRIKSGKIFKADKSQSKPKLSKCSLRVREFGCVNCHNVYKTQAALTCHMLGKCSKYESNASLMCEHCSKVYTNASIFKKHALVCTQRKNEETCLTCDLCKATFSIKERLRDHIKNVHTEKRQPCSECGKLFKTASHVRNHMVVHTKEKLFQCEFCEKGFATKNAFKYHQRLHSGDRPFACPYCNERSLSASRLNYHIKTVHTARNLPCEECGKMFKTKRQVHNHMVCHMSEKQFTCEYCDQKFVAKNALVYHQRLHTGERPYSCSMCDERFLSASRRMMHVKRVHIGRQLSCSICSNKFLTNYDLRKHEERHFKSGIKIKTTS